MKRHHFTIGVLALALSGAAHATIDTGYDGEDEFGDIIPGSRNGTVFFNAYDPVAAVSYIRGLDQTYNSFAPTQGAPASLSYNLATDPDWNAFLARVTPGNILYNVVSLGDSGNGRNNFLSTVRLNPSLDATTLTSQELANATSQAVVGTTPATDNFGLGGFSGVVGYVNLSNASVDATFNSTYRVRDGATDVQYFGFGFQDNWAGSAYFSSTALAGTALAFAKLAPGSTPDVGSQPVGVTAYEGYWKLGTDGVLTYTGVTPVPEPGTWALMGLGLLGMGAGVARQRRR